MFSLNGLAAMLVISVSIFITFFVLDLIVGALAFFVHDIWWFSHLKLIVFGIVGGMSFPFEFLSKNLQGLFNFLPFKFSYYIPISYLQSNRSISHLPLDLFLITVWLTVFFIVAIVMWKKGIAKYDAYGN